MFGFETRFAVQFSLLWFLSFFFYFPEESLVPYSKPSFPSPGGHSSSGTASSKGSTGPRKAEVLRGGHQRNASDLLDIGYVGSNSQGQFTGELCKSFGSFQRPSWFWKYIGLMEPLHLNIFLNDRKFPLLINNRIILFWIGHKLKDKVYSSQWCKYFIGISSLFKLYTILLMPEINLNI